MKSPSLTKEAQKEEKDVSGGDFCFQKALNEVTSGFPERSRSIILMRYGISQKNPKTLEEIGNSYRVTRERIRQIIREVIKKVEEKKENPILQEVSRKITFTVNEKSGIIKKKELIKLLGKGNEKESGAVEFFLDCLKDPVMAETKGEMEESCIRIEFDLDYWKKIKDIAKNVLEAEGKPINDDELAKKILLQVPAITRKKLFDYLAPSKEIVKNNFGKWGLDNWPEITPKGTREKAYLMLKESDRPLHFREVASLIDHYKLSKKKTHPQTVHNELIKDSRFVLVGRGVYALSSWGYKKGTVKEVLEEILKNNKGPMKRGDILNQILKVRQVKKSTVIINLNNFFLKTGRDEYTIRR
ncbi:MAG: HTH domain-containing protein [Candidatus Moranbacteria bacterium]|nr:HTH domain-containing protein [Candidatus Moranbacteria bacterium]